jgi:hydroxyethylthiazole kinase-like uncharacterized protein yjeF
MGWVRIVTAAQMRQIEQEAFASGVSQPSLMRRAGEAVAARALAMLADPRRASVLVLVGPGNNGGDGLVVAEALADAGVRDVRPWLYRREGLRGAPVAAALLDRLPPLDTGGLTRAIAEVDLIVDALYGIGARDELPDDLSATLRAINARAGDPGVTLLALDLPTGVNADTGTVAGVAFSADLTVTLGRPKRGLFEGAGVRQAGRIIVETIGLRGGAVDGVTPRTIGREDALARLPRRAEDAHKGDAGSLIIIGGSLNYLGAPTLAGHAALRAGVGLLTLAVPRSLLGPIASQIAEATYLPLPEAEWGTVGPEAIKVLSEGLARYTAVQIGNGLGREKATGEFLGRLFSFSPGERGKAPVGFRPLGAAGEAAPDEAIITVPTLIDADGLNLLSEVERWWEKIGDLPLILTPHHGELARLRGVEREAISATPWQAALDAAREWRQVVVLKGGYTVVATPDGDLWVASLANPALAAAGTGDTLAGLIAGFLAQKLAPADAAILGLWVGGRAGELARAAIGTLPLLAGDLPRFIGEAIHELEMGAGAE